MALLESVLGNGNGKGEGNGNGWKWKALTAGLTVIGAIAGTGYHYYPEREPEPAYSSRQNSALDARVRTNSENIKGLQDQMEKVLSDLRGGVYCQGVNDAVAGKFKSIEDLADDRLSMFRDVRSDAQQLDRRVSKLETCKCR